MNAWRWLIVASGVLGIWHIALAQDVPWHYSFEETTLSAAYRKDASSVLSLSTRRYKLGQQSLKWTWQSNGWILFTDPAPERSTALSAFRAWVYSETALADKVLTFRFGTASELATDNPRYQFEFGLNFTGWRTMWIELREDARNASYSGSGGGRVTAFDIRAPNNSGSVYLDLIEMVTSNRIRRRVADAQVPFVNGGINASGGQNREYRWSLNTLPGAIPSLSAKEVQDFRQAFQTISNRYDNWVLGSNVKTDMRVPVQTRLTALAAHISRGHRNLLTRYNVRRESDGRIMGIPLFADFSPYDRSFQSFVQAVILRLAVDYRLNSNAQAKDRALEAFDYLHDQGWAAGSGIGSLHHEFLRIAAYAHAVFLMRNDLNDMDTPGRLAREAETLGWHCLFGEIYESSWDPGTNADFLRSVAIFRLFRVLLMDGSTSANMATKVANMRRYIAWLNNALDIAPGWLDTIKPDYTGFHHRGIYANAYAPNAFHMASLLVYLLHDTPFAVADDKRENLKQALLTANIMTHTYDITPAIGGRFPHNTDMANKLLPAYMYMALISTPVDPQLAGIFMQLWKPDSQFLQNEFSRVAARIMYFHSPGAIQMMVNFAEAGHTPTTAPSGHWTLPYGALSIHRRDDWMVSMKGWSKYVWDFESSDGGENQLGRYVSYGSTLIYGSGDPVGREASGFVRDGWDWSMWPGTTVIRLTHAELNNKGRDRIFSDETFVGGVDMEGQDGVFALKLHDTEHNTSFRAVKTVFCFDDLLVCLGSGIGNNDRGHATVTPLFQASISRDQATVVNGTGMLAIPYTFSGTSGQRAWLMDASGNGYVIPNGGNLQVQRQVQTPGDFGEDSGGTGTFELAYLDHGNAPSNKGYEYAVLVQQPIRQVRKFAEAPEYVVRQRDGNAHIVHHRGLKTTGYALFNTAARPMSGLVKSVSLPSLVMTREEEDGLLLSVADPDYGWSRTIQTRHRQDGSLIVNQPSVPRTVTVTVRGQWGLVGMHDDVSIADVQSDDTMVAFICEHGATVQATLVRTGISASVLNGLDFDGNGVVGIEDFLLLVSKFGLWEGDAGFESKYDIDGNGIVGFSDFLIFAEGFGKSVSGKPVALRNGGARLGS